MKTTLSQILRITLITFLGFSNIFTTTAQVETVIFPDALYTEFFQPTKGYGVVGNRLIFLTGEHELKATDGTNVIDLIEPGPVNGLQKWIVYNNKYYINSINKLYVTDGTSQGSTLLSEFGEQYSSIDNFEIFNGELYFIQSGIIYRYNDATMLQPQPLSGAVERVFEMEVVGNQLYFFTMNESFLSQQYWVGDGTVAGSTLISTDTHDFTTNCSFAPFTSVDNLYSLYSQQLCAGPNKFFINQQEHPVDWRNFNYFTLNGALYFSGNYNGVQAVYAYNNGTPQLYAQENVAIDQVVNSLYKTSNSNIAFSDNNLWSLQNGSLSNIYSFPNGSTVAPHSVLNDKVYFEVDLEDGTPIGLWETDGTTAGTIQLTELSSELANLDFFDGNLYYHNKGGTTRNLKKLTLDPNYNPPIPTLSTPSATVQGPFTINVSFSQPVTGFELSDVYSPGSVLSNLSGSGSNYSFTATPGPSTVVFYQILNATSSNSVGELSTSSNLLSVTAEVDVSCTTTLTAGPDFISFDFNYAPRSTIQIYFNGATIYSCGTNDCPYDDVIENLAPGSYYYNVQIWFANFEEICAFDGNIVVDGSGCTDMDGDGVCADQDCDDNNATIPTFPGLACNDNNPNTINDVIQNDGCTCAGTPDNPTDCQVSAGVSGNTILVSGLTPDANTKIFDSAFGTVFSCNPWSGNACTGSEQIPNLPQGTYYLSVQSDACDEWITLTVEAAGTCELDMTVTNFICNGGEVSYDLFVTGTNTTGNTFTTSIQAGFGAIEVEYAYNETHTIVENFTSPLNSVVISVWDTGLNTCFTSVTEQCQGAGCNVQVSSAAGLVQITGLTSDANAKLFDASIASVFECNPWNGNACSVSEVVPGLTVGATYYLSVQSTECSEWIPVVVQGGNGCIDNDSDGVCLDEDCNDTDPNVPAPAGTPCNDFDANTENDVIQANGCDCMGTPINPTGCNVAATADGGSIIIVGLTTDINAKVFDSDYGVVYSCNPWSGSPCSGTATVSGLASGQTYFVSAVSDDCEVWIPVTIGGSNANQPDLTVSNLSIPSAAFGILNYSFDLNNVGNATANGDYVINAYISVDNVFNSMDILAGEIITGNTGVGTIPTVLGSASVPISLNGEYYLILVVDGNNEISESNEGNNILVSSNTFVVEPVNFFQAPKTEDATIQVVNLFPNPTADDLFIQLESIQDQSVSMTVYDLNGKAMLQQVVDVEEGRNSFEIETGNLTVGMYQVQIMTDQQTITKRFVKN